MADMDEALRRKVERTQVPEDAFERLVRERSRRQRNGRLGAAALALVVAAAGAGFAWASFDGGGHGHAAASSPARPSPTSSVVVGIVVPWDQVPTPPDGFGFGFDVSTWAGQGVARVAFADGGHHGPSQATGALTAYTTTLKTQGWVVSWETPVAQHGSLGDPGCYGGGRAFARGGLRLWVFSGGCPDGLRFTVFRGPLRVVHLASGQRSGTLIGPREPASGIEPDFALERAWEEMSETAANGVLLVFGVSDDPPTGLAKGVAGWTATFQHVCQIGFGGPAVLPSGASASPMTAPTCTWTDTGVLLDGRTGRFVVAG